jgi:hypothetical protein
LADFGQWRKLGCFNTNTYAEITSSLLADRLREPSSSQAQVPTGTQGENLTTEIRLMLQNAHHSLNDVGTLVGINIHNTIQIKIFQAVGEPEE